MSRGSRFGLSWAKASESTDAGESSSNQPQWGMHILENKDADSTEAVDVIAIHGINGHWNNTWKDESTGTNWLQDSIPKYLKTARVMSFSYNSSVQFSKSVSGIADFAEQLLEDLMAQRVSGAERDRPILFICHSLGGIVFKQACNRAHESHRYRRLLKAIAGVVFFGTPHRGSSMASLGNILSRVLRAASLGTHTNAQLLKDLETGSRLLDDITTVFVDRKYDFQICSYYETDKMDFMNTVVVDRHSAILGIERETAAPMNGNHRSMCRFARSDPRLPVVLANLAEMVRRWTERNRRVSEGVFFDRLGASNHLLHKDRNPSPIQGTCSWVLSHPEFKRWHEATGPALMWLSANPGCGKSVMMSFLIDHLQYSVVSEKVRICYWFFKSDNQEQRSAIFALRGMLRQLLEARRAAIQTVQDAAKDKNLDSLQDVWKLFIQAVYKGTSVEEASDKSLQSPPVRPITICLLDGLDECETESKREFILLFQKYFREVEQLQPEAETPEWKTGFMKVLIASRPENWIKIAIDRLKPAMPNTASQQIQRYEPTTQCCAIRLKAEDEPGLISADISIVVRAAIADLVTQGFPEPLLHDIQQRLIARADRTFIWVTLMIELLRDKVEAGASKREMDSILESRTLDEIFTEFLRGRPDAPKTRKLFSIMLAAARPLNVEELSIALALTPEHDALSEVRRPFRPGLLSVDTLEYDLVYPFENHIRSLGGHFIRIIRNEVYFVHETAREFLLEDNRKGINPFAREEVTLAHDDWSFIQDPKHCPWQHSFPYRSCHALLLDLCATYLYLIGQATVHNRSLSEDQAILINYVSKSWFIHFAVVIDHIDSHNLPYYQNLCHPRFPGFGSWTEAYWERRTEINPTTGMIDDEIQDYYIDKLGLDARPLSPASDDNYDKYFDDGDVGSEMEDSKTVVDEKEFGSAHAMMPIPNHRNHGPSLRDELVAQKMQRGALSVNPTAKSNHNFPLSVDQYGFVSLDHGVG